MTTFIELTRANNVVDEEGHIGETFFINAGKVNVIMKNPSIENTTLVHMTETTFLVRETPQEIIEKIFNAEHPGCRL